MEEHRDDYTRTGWLEDRRYVLLELDRMGRVITGISDRVDKVRLEDLAVLKTDIALLKFQAALWGSLGGIIFGSVVTLALKLLVR